MKNKVQKLNAAQRFLKSAEKYPGRPALEKGAVRWTYGQLTEEAHTISRRIVESGDTGPFVAVLADKSPECYTAILGVLLAGKAYLPLNPKFPKSRNQFMLEKAGAEILIANGIIQPTGIPSQAKSKGAAYLLFTSGTTGEPKGVPVSHDNLSAYLDFMLDAYSFNPDDRFSQVFDLTFDLSVHDMFLCWSAGACLCVPEDNSSFALAKFIREKQPTAWFSVPSAAMLMQRMRLLKPSAFPSIRYSFFCGEPLYAITAEEWRGAAPNAPVINLYGPTEATIAISRYELPAVVADVRQEMGIVAIGKIFAGNSFMLWPQEENQEGELCLSGPQVVDRYFENPEADSQSFFDHHGARWYRTGDLARVDSDGILYYVGRTDAEVKISGYRVNLKEVENTLAAHPAIDQAVVTYENDKGRQENLCAYILPSTGLIIDESDTMGFCRERLPWYMVPGKFIFVKDIPLNPNGKVDRKALKEKYDQKH